MKKQGIAIAFTVATISFVVLLIGGAAVIYSAFENRYNPNHKGKRVRVWARIAIWNSDPAARREAAQALVEAFKGMEDGEPRTQLTMVFCFARENDRGEPELPKEVLPFLLEVLHAKEMPPGSYQSIALSQVEPDAAVPALLEVILKDEDSRAREGATKAFPLMGKRAVPALQQMLGEGDEQKRKLAADILQQIEGNAAKPR